MLKGQSRQRSDLVPYLGLHKTLYDRLNLLHTHKNEEMIEKNERQNFEILKFTRVTAQ